MQRREALGGARQTDRVVEQLQLVIQSYTAWGGSSCAGCPGNSIRSPAKYLVETGGETSWRYQRLGDLTGKQRRTERCLKFLLHEVLKVSPCRERVSDLGSIGTLALPPGFQWWLESLPAALLWGEGGVRPGQVDSLLRGEGFREKQPSTPMKCRVAI